MRAGQLAVLTEARVAFPLFLVFGEQANTRRIPLQIFNFLRRSFTNAALCAHCSRVLAQFCPTKQLPDF
jgi:hypothetical protein